ncbi:MAG: extracellular solute-binding protein [Bacillota bacterium]
MRSSKRLFAICLSVLLVFCFVFAGCANNSSDVARKDEPKESSGPGASGTSGNLEPITITVYNSLAGVSPAQDNKIYKLIKEKLGVTFKFEFLVGEAQQKAGVMIAGGDYPDIIGIQGHAAQQFIDAGAFIPLEGLIDKYPNLKKHYGPLKNRIKDPDSGHVYVMPNYGVHTGTVYQNETWGPSFWIQKAVLKEFGYPKVETLDDFFDLIRKYKEKYPTIDGQPTIGFEILTDKGRDWPLRNAPAQLAGYPNDGSVIVDNNVAKIYADKDISKKYFKKLNEMYHLGLVDPESFVMNYDQYIAKLSSGRVLGLYDQRWNFNKANTSLMEQQKDERAYAPCPVTFNKNIKDWYLTNPTLNINSGYAISTKCKNPDRVMQIFDALLSEEWQKILQWGIEGEDYMVGSDGKFYRTAQQRVEQESNEWKLANRAEALLDFMPKLEGTYVDGNATSPGLQPGEYYDGLRPIDKEMLSAYGVQTQGQLFSTPPKDPIYFPCYTIQIPQGSKEQVADQKLRDYAFQYLPNIIKSNPDQFEKQWDKYVDQLKKVDVKSLEDLYNKGIQDRIKNWSEN